MRILTDKTLLTSVVKGQHIFIDNDFLGQLYEHEEILEQFIDLVPESILVIDPFTEIEFRRDVFLPEQKKLKEEFVNLPLFEPIPDHQSIYQKIKDNSLLLSQIYAHQNEHGASLVDLMLAARLMLTPYATLVITGNRKDFPGVIFDNEAILNVENPKGIVQPFYLIKFNKEKFDICYKKFNSLK